MKSVVPFLVSIVPLALTPLLVWTISEGYVDLGGGEKDLIMVLPWMVWSVFFAGAFLIASRKGHSIGASSLRAAGWATGLIVCLWLLLWVAARDWLGA